MGYFCPKTEHISKFPTEIELITDELVFWSNTGFTARLMLVYTRLTKTNGFFFKRRIMANCGLENNEYF